MKVVEAGEVSAEDEGRARYGPESKFCALLVGREAGLADFAPAGIWAEPAFGEHVCVGPVAGAGVGVPLGEVIEHVTHAHGEFGIGQAQKGPAVPMVVGDTPHLRVFLDFSCMLDLRWAGGEREHDMTAGFANGIGDLANLCGAIWMVGDAIDFEKIEAPRGVEANHRIVVGLAGGVVLDTPNCPGPTRRGMWCLPRRWRGRMNRRWADWRRQPGGEFRGRCEFRI